MDELSLPLWIGEFVEESKSKIDMAKMFSSFTHELISQGGTVDDSLLKELATDMRAPYEKALNCLPEDSREREMLKDAYAYLLSMFNDFLPHKTETLAEYESRIAERTFQFNVVANRLILGK